MILFIFLVVLGYLMGSICSAVIVCKSCSLPDPRTQGSKNPGATNVLRIAGKQYAALVMVADLLKGTIPVLIAKLLGADTIIVGFTALAAVIGHMYPVFFDFKGGKGVATAIGALLGLEFIVGIMVAATWLIVAKFSRYSSLASIVSIGMAPFYSLLIFHNLNVFPPLFIIALLILYKHRNNITRLIDKTEPKIKLKQNILGNIMEEAHSKTVVAKKPEAVSTQIEIETVTETIIKKPKAKEIPKTQKTTRKKAEAPIKKTSTTKKPTATKTKTKKPTEK
ncbi:MAG: glycerol-3-phosphate 1-O-acyltransferase PlsY [Legionella longbeachae]|nr:glycerol-3-phosphate 1-O-acyltransferase PlsY [Legionella longbeachae]